MFKCIHLLISASETEDGFEKSWSPAIIKFVLTLFSFSFLEALRNSNIPLSIKILDGNKKVQFESSYFLTRGWNFLQSTPEPFIKYAWLALQNPESINNCWSSKFWKINFAFSFLKKNLNKGFKMSSLSLLIKLLFIKRYPSPVIDWTKLTFSL